MKAIVLTISHVGALLVGFALGVYLLPILTAPASPDRAELETMAQQALYRAEFTREQRGSDFLHWGEGSISLGPDKIVHVGELAPGPDYKLYLVPEFVEHEDEFLPVKDRSTIVGDVKTFNGFLVDVPAGVDIEQYTTVLVWCEAFGEFIASAKYR
jgi:hypothetical protein